MFALSRWAITHKQHYDHNTEKSRAHLSHHFQSCTRLHEAGSGTGKHAIPGPVAILEPASAGLSPLQRRRVTVAGLWLWRHAVR